MIWISVKDRLPEPGSRVLVTENLGQMHAAWLDGDKWRRLGSDSIGGTVRNVTHWMEQPVPPQEVIEAMDRERAKAQRMTDELPPGCVPEAHIDRWRMYWAPNKTVTAESVGVKP